MTVFQRIQSLCEANGMTVSALEVKLGFSHYSLVEGKVENIRSDRLLKLADYFDVSTDWLLTGKENGQETYALTPEERNIITLFRNLDDTGKYLVAQDLKTYADAGFVKK